MFKFKYISENQETGRLGATFIAIDDYDLFQVKSFDNLYFADGNHP